jgi:hypothetical protein
MHGLQLLLLAVVVPSGIYGTLLALSQPVLDGVRALVGNARQVQDCGADGLWGGGVGQQQQLLT